jgi:hypothetical protein
MSLRQDQPPLTKKISKVGFQPNHKTNKPQRPWSDKLRQKIHSIPQLVASRTTKQPTTNILHSSGDERIYHWQHTTPPVTQSLSHSVMLVTMATNVPGGGPTTGFFSPNDGPTAMPFFAARRWSACASKGSPTTNWMVLHTLRYQNRVESLWMFFLFFCLNRADEIYSRCNEFSAGSCACPLSLPWTLFKVIYSLRDACQTSLLYRSKNSTPPTQAREIYIVPAPATSATTTTTETKMTTDVARPSTSAFRLNFLKLASSTKQSYRTSRVMNHDHFSSNNRQLWLVAALTLCLETRKPAESFFFYIGYTCTCSTRQETATDTSRENEKEKKKQGQWQCHQSNIPTATPPTTRHSRLQQQRVKGKIPKSNGAYFFTSWKKMKVKGQHGDDDYLFNNGRKYWSAETTTTTTTSCAA